MSSFGKSYDPFSTVFLGASSIYFSKIQKLEPYFLISQIPDPRKSVLGPGDVFACFPGPTIYRFVYHVDNFYEFSPVLHKSSSYAPFLQYGISPFLKQF